MREAIRMQVFGASDAGQKRRHNEDNFNIWQSENMLVAAVADGMGGAAAGEVASCIALRKFTQEFRGRLENIDTEKFDRVQLMLDIDRAIDLSVETCNREVFAKQSEDGRLAGMGTTIAGCVIVGDILWAFNVGDSRVYRVGRDSITQLTVDHSLVQSLLDAGKITPEEALSHPNRNIILRAVGIEESVSCDVRHMNLEDGFYLICSDGLSNYFNEEKFLDIINSQEALSDKTFSLIEWANAQGGADNITAVLIDTEMKAEA